MRNAWRRGRCRLGESHIVWQVEALAALVCPLAAEDCPQECEDQDALQRHIVAVHSRTPCRSPFGKDVVMFVGEGGK